MVRDAQIKRPSATLDTQELEESYVPANHLPVNVSSVGSDVVPTVFFITWTADWGYGQVEYGLTPDLGLTTPRTELTDSHEQAVFGLKASHQYYWRVSNEHEDGTVATSAIDVWQVPDPPETLRLHELLQVDVDRSEVANAFLLLTPNHPVTSYAAIIDGDADLVWWVAADPGQHITRARPAMDGRGILYSSYRMMDITQNGRIQRMDLDGRRQTTTRALYQHHDFVERGDGLLAFPSFEFAVFDVDDQPLNIASDAIRLAPEGYDQEEEYDRSLAYFADYPHEPWYTCQHFALNGSFVPGYHEWTHTNSVAYEPTEDALYMLPRYFDALLKTDATSGQILWQLGGIHGDFTSDEGGDLLEHSHFSQVWPGGVLLFDNGNHADSVSSVIEYSIDETNMTVEKVWEYTRADRGFTSFLGDARRLEGGNTLIMYSPEGELREVTPDGETVWLADTTVVSGRVIPILDLYDL